MDRFDIVHFHNKATPTSKPKLIQYHSHPDRVDMRFDGLKTVVAQYQALIEEFKDYKMVRNIIDINSPQYEKYIERENIRIGYSPSSLVYSNGDMPERKGYIEVSRVLTSLCQKYDDVHIDIIVKTDHKECMERKRRCNIIIDECSTESYHRSGLEGLALGSLTICSLSNEVSELLKKVSGQENIPFENIWIDYLEEYLEKIINRGKQDILDKGEENRKWMEKFWNPVDIVREFEKIYDSLL